MSASLQIGCTLAPTPEAPQLAAMAERLGYRWVWINDSPANYANSWVVLDRVARATEAVEIGPAVLSPSLHHVMETAGALATLELAAPGRVVAVIGSGDAAPGAIGRRPSTLAEVGAYVQALRALLAGEIAEVDGALVEMLQPPGWVADRPLTIRLLIAAAGPRAVELGNRVGDGILSPRLPQIPGQGHWVRTLAGTVLGPAETLTDRRVRRAAGPGIDIRYRAAYARAGTAGAAALPGGEAWAARYEAIEPSRRHLELNRGHYAPMAEEETTHLTAEAISELSFTGDPELLRRRLGELSEGGATGVTYHPAGPDLARELTAFAKACMLVTA